MRIFFNIMVGKSEDSIKIDLNELVCEDVDWIQVAMDRVNYRSIVNIVMYSQDS
jgi:hypothetical protein